MANPGQPMPSSVAPPGFPTFSPSGSTMPNQPANISRPNYQSSNHQSYQSPKFVKKGLAIFSMLLGIFSFPLINMIIGVVLSLIGGILFGVGGAIAGVVIALLCLPMGLITGIVAVVKASRRPNEYGGKGFAITGIVLSSLALVFIPLVAVIAVPNLLAARRAANEGSAIASLKTIANAQVNFATSKYRCGELTELGGAGLIDTELAKGTKSGYQFLIARTIKGCEILAKPTETEGVTTSGSRSFFFSTEEGVLRASSDIKNFANDQNEKVEIDGFPPAYTFSSPQLNTPLQPLPVVPPNTEKIDYSIR